MAGSMKNFTGMFEGSQRALDTANIVCLTIVILAGLIFNTSALVYIIHKPTKSTFKDKIVTLLCICNGLQSIGFAIELSAAIRGKTTSGFCEAAAFIVVSLTYTSIGYFVALALERCIAIGYPFKYVVLFSDNKNTQWLLAPPVFGFGLAMGPLLGWSKYGKARNISTYCSFDFADNDAVAKSYFITAVVVAFVIPFTLTAICFIIILKDLKRVANDAQRTYGKNSNITRSRAKTVKEQSISCLLTGLVYVVSWIPYALVCSVFYFGGQVSVGVEHFSIYLSKSSTISSPVVYCMIEKRFRVSVKPRSSVDFNP